MPTLSPSRWLAILCALAAHPVMAADAGADLRRHQDETWRAIQPPLGEPPPAPPVAPPRSDAAATASDARVYVEGFETHGVTVLSAEDVLGTLGPFSGRELDTRGLQAAARALQDRYRQSGYFLAKVLLPPQTFGRVVRLDVFEGLLDKPGIEVVNKGQRVRTEVVEGVLRHHLDGGTPVRAEAMERALLLAEDLPGVRTSNLLYPGQAVGTARLRTVLTNEPLVAGNVDADNFGSHDTGQERLGTTVYVNSPGSVGDQIIGRLVTSGARSNYGYLQYLRPVSPAGWRAGLSIDHLRYKTREYQDLGRVRGSASDLRLLATYPVIRARHANLNVRLEAGRARLKDRAGADFASDRQVDTVRLALDGNRSRDAWPGGISYTDLDLTAGRLRVRGNDAFRTYDREGPGTAGGFARVGLTLQRLQRLGGPWVAHVKWSGQAASTNLDSSQKYHLGGATSVAGYPVGQASGDHGWELHAELRRELPSPLGGPLHAYVFAQHGEVRQHHDTWDGWQGANPAQSNRIRLGTVGLGVVQTIPGRWVIRGLVGWQTGSHPFADPVTGTDNDGRSRDWRAWLQVIRYF